MVGDLLPEGGSLGLGNSQNRNQKELTMHANATTLTPDLLQKMNAYWRAANYLSVGQIISTTIRCLKNH